MLDLPLEYALIEFKGNKFFRQDRARSRWIWQSAASCALWISSSSRKRKTVACERSNSTTWMKSHTECSSRSARTSPSLFTTDDLEIAMSKLRKNSAAMLLLWENLWTASLRKAIADAGGQLVERRQISPEVVKQFKRELAAEVRQQAAAKKSAAGKKTAAGKKSAATKKKAVAKEM